MPLSPIKAVYPGSFDPPTLGHVDVVKRAVRIFGSLTILVAESAKKTSLFSPEERKSLLQDALKGLNVQVVCFSGLTVDYLKQNATQVIIRGIRAVSDFEYELQMATMNRKLAPEIETLVVMTGEEYFYISSNTVKEVAMHGGDISSFVPPKVALAIREKLRSAH